MAQLRIDEVLPSKSGKAWRVKSGGEWYNAFGDSGIEAHAGKLIDAEITTHSTYGKGISKYKVIGAIPPAQLPQAQGPTRPASADYMPHLSFCSNTVAHAIAAGLIKEPSDIKVWFLAAKHAVDGD